MPGKPIAILGSTGSIGRQTLEVCRLLDRPVAALAAGRNVRLLAQQAREFRPDLVSVATEKDALALEKELSGLGIKVLCQNEGLRAVATHERAGMVMAAVVGFAGLMPVMAAIRAGKDIALANKETLVAGGALVLPLLQEHEVSLYPVDSEHSAIWQCLMGTRPQHLRRILLTASGGPFRGMSPEQLKQVTLEQALRHPTWEMGGKITIDSATLMNKGLEAIEASWLFGCPIDQIEVVVHPQSIIHSMVEFEDGSVLSQMGFPDMKLPIQLALTFPARVPTGQRPFDPFDAAAATLTFEKPDLEAFPLLSLAYDAAREGGTLPAVLNAANEKAVELFLQGKLTFSQIAPKVERCMQRHLKQNFQSSFDFDALFSVDAWARTIVEES